MFETWLQTNVEYSTRIARTKAERSRMVAPGGPERERHQQQKKLAQPWRECKLNLEARPRSEKLVEGLLQPLNAIADFCDVRAGETQAQFAVAFLVGIKEAAGRKYHALRYRQLI